LGAAAEQTGKGDLTSRRRALRPASEKIEGQEGGKRGGGWRGGGGGWD